MVDERICLCLSIDGDAIVKIDYENCHVVGNGEADGSLPGRHWARIAQAERIGPYGGYIEPLAMEFKLDRDVGRIIRE